MANCNDPAVAEPQYPQRYDQNTVTPYIVDRSGGKQKGVSAVCILMLRYNRMAYCKSKPGDCGSPQSSGGASPYAVAQSAGAVAGSGVGVASAVGLAVPSALSTATVFLAPVGLILGVFAGISAHHKQAVATEQATICQVVTAFNQVMDNLEPAVAAGKVSLQQAIQYLQNAHDTLANILQSIEHVCNAACFYHSCLDSLLAFNKKYVLPSLVPNQQTVLAPQGLAGSQTTPQSSTPSPAPASSSSTPTFLAAAGLVGAKLAGVY